MIQSTAPSPRLLAWGQAPAAAPRPTSAQAPAMAGDRLTLSGAGAPRRPSTAFAQSFLQTMRTVYTLRTDKQPTPAPAVPGVPPLPASARVVTPSLTGDAARSLQAAIDGLGPEGGVVKLPAGTFTLNAPITLRSHVHLAGVPGQTVLKGGAARGVFLNFNTTNTSLRDMVIDGNGVASRGMYAGRAKEIGIYHCEIKNIPATGEYGSGTGVYFESEVSDSRIIGNRIHDLGQGEETAIGIAMARGSHRNVMTHNTIDNVGRNGIGANTDCQDLYIAHNTITRVRGHGLSVELWKDCSGVTEHNTMGSWISYDKSTGAIRNNVVDSALASKRALMGIEVVAVDGGLVVEDNVVKGAQYGLSLSRGTANVLFKNNTFEGVYWGASTYAEEQPSPGNRFIGNTIRGDGSADGRGLFLNGPSNHTVIEGNRIEGFAMPYVVRGTDAGTLTVRNNAGF